MMPMARFGHLKYLFSLRQNIHITKLHAIYARHVDERKKESGRLFATSRDDGAAYALDDDAAT